MNKIVVAITGASGSIYASQLLAKLTALKDQWQELSVVMTENAKQVAMAANNATEENLTNL